MEPVEINAGAWYLRGLRADERITDVPALSDLGIADPAAYVAATDAAWRDDTGFVWAVCEPTTGELLAVIGVLPTAGSASIAGRCRTGHRAVLGAAVGPVARFARGALDLVVDDLASDDDPVADGVITDAIPTL
ncbi:hypothetical protein GPOL_c17220 [Gordonia polyisoprenivorans VH2]|uniref:Uncharacterized protein n=1 Tax=Gordonia polyisoprenivorans (strain DSM 44266 / VH2) TaxID=1112204 RepID=H6MV64_GORPV|nr:hypothetical protein [Gordonia polyisoprenivorans]AFA72771.1 hypothetical protein GPOL_c17220 [Gordonia polyisoprenivorans VH2]